MKTSSALIVFAKVPAPNKVKTRLTHLLSPQEAADLYASFLFDALEQYTGLRVDVRLYLSPTEDSIPDELRIDGVSLHTQVGNDLGERMAHAFVETFMAGYQHAVIIGTDHPTLPSSFIEHAYNLLEKPYTVVIGPSEDGGYYLLGMNEFYPQLFQDMTYSHSNVYEDTLDRARSLKAELSILPEWYDVDTPEALQKLIGEIEGAHAPLTRTRKTISRLVELYPLLIV